MAMTQQEKADRKAVFSKAKEYLGSGYNATLVNKQVTQYMSQKLSAEDICGALDYFYGVRGNDVSKSRGGIGIVPYVVQEAKEYYARLAAIESQAEERGRNVDAEAAMSAQPRVIATRREPVSRPRSWNSFDLT